jgi:hypothetical protein
MNPPENLPAQMADKTNDELSAMFKSPQDWLPEALDAARAELQRRGIDASAIPVGPPPIPEGHPVFFPVSPLKLVVMSIVTFGIYELYWFYKNWKLIKQRTSRDIMPFWRAFFAFFFCYSLFREVTDSATSRSMSVGFSPGLLAFVWIGLTLCWRLPDPYWLVSTVAVLALLPVQKTVNELNATVAPGHDLNARFYGWNIVGIAVGGLFLVFAIIGTFFPE